MEVKEEKKKNNNKKLAYIVILIAVLLIILVVTSRKGSVELKVKSSLDKIVEKSNLETVSFTYNVIAKQCKKNEKCKKNSNDIDDFEYVVSCKGKVSAGIDFKNVEVKVDEKNKKLIVQMPEAKVKETNVVSLEFLNGEDISADELPNARKLCDNTIKEKSNKDESLLPAAKEQAKVVLQSFYENWIKTLDGYTVEVK